MQLSPISEGYREAARGDEKELLSEGKGEKSWGQLSWNTVPVYVQTDSIYIDRKLAFISLE